MSRTVVVALGGNALTRQGQAGSYAEQAANALGMAAVVGQLRGAGWTVVLVHGNGPQVGNLAVQQWAGASQVPEQPMFLLNAMTEGQLGSLLTLALRQVCGALLPGVVTVVTHVVVDPEDPAFRQPSKPIGPYLSEAEADREVAERGWVVGEDAGRGLRRMVPSPRPLRIVELDALRALVGLGHVVIAAGGGGVPVVPDGPGYRGVEAVIDKDLAAQRLATELGADALVMITDVPRVMLDYGTPRARAVDQMTVEQAVEYAAQHQFPDGSMGPKVRAAIQFVRAGGQVAVITNSARACASLEPEAHPDAELGTRIVATEQRLGAVP